MLHNPANPNRYPDEMWTKESGRYVGIGGLNAAPDAKYADVSDGYIDLMIGRFGTILQSIKLAALFICGKELKSNLMDYFKVKAVRFVKDGPNDVMNLDGEAIHGEGPFRVEVVPSIIKVLSEK